MVRLNQSSAICTSAECHQVRRVERLCHCVLLLLAARDQGEQLSSFPIVLVVLGLMHLFQNLTLEELDVVFSVGNREHALYYWNKLPWYFRKNILRRKVEPFPPLYQLAGGQAAQD